jgi:glycosyltransferase involved in cell wall biosynthesis
MISVIIRTKNEEFWIKHCLKAVFSQKLSNHELEVIIVDNESSDNTLKIASQFPIAKIVHIKEYFPGYCINEGIKASKGEFVAILSSHCVPKNDDWLEYLVKDMESNEKIAGTYGKQLPVSFSSPQSYRDLYVTFGNEKRIQKQDSFFHNANSIIRKKIWQIHNFDEKISNIEDRIWAKKILEAGFYISYEPKAEVYHHHGIHHDTNLERANSTLSVMKSIEGVLSSELLPNSMKPEFSDIISILPISNELDDPLHKKSFIKMVNKIHSSGFVKDIFVVTNNKNFHHKDDKFKVFKKKTTSKNSNTSLVDEISHALDQINSDGRYPDYIFYANYDYFYRPPDLIKMLIQDICYKGKKSVFVAAEEFKNIWKYDETYKIYTKVMDDLRSRDKKLPIYKSLFGLGVITRPEIIKQGKLVADENVGVIINNDTKMSLRLSNPYEYELIKKLDA